MTSKVEESFLVAILYLVMDGLNGLELALIPRRNLREKNTSLFIYEWLRPSVLEKKSNP